MHADHFSGSMENSWILLDSFRQKIHAFYKILQEFDSNMEDSYKTFM